MTYFDSRRRLGRWKPGRFDIPLEPLQIGSYVSSVLVSQVSIFFKALEDDSFEFRWKIRVQPDRAYRLPFQNSTKNDPRTLSAKGHLTGRHFVQDRTKGKHIGP